MVYRKNLWVGYRYSKEKNNINDKYNTKLVSLNEVFEKADIISINATYTPENVNIISSEQLDKLKPNAIIVNTAR